MRPGEPLLVMVSGGGDSVALLDIADRLGAAVSALHVNYGLREGADADEDVRPRPRRAPRLTFTHIA